MSTITHEYQQALVEAAATLEAPWQPNMQKAMDILLTEPGRTVGVEHTPEGQPVYLVTSDDKTYRLVLPEGCPCSDAKHRGRHCKHLTAVELWLRLDGKTLQEVPPAAAPVQDGTPVAACPPNTPEGLLAPPTNGHTPTPKERHMEKPAAPRPRPAPLSLEQRKADAIAQAEAVCTAATEATPPAYRNFLMLLPQGKKIGEDATGKGIYANIRQPYMGVDGRVKMAMDEHREKEATLAMHTTFADCGETLLCQAVVTSSLLGTATGHARVSLGGVGVDRTNPHENAETSAVGRALGFLGYGIYGMGIASAEEVLQARDAQETLDRAPAAARTEAPVDGASRPPSERQLGFLRSLLEKAGVHPVEIDDELDGITTSREASERINQLREEG